mgnify:CR=1 FL=1
MLQFPHHHHSSWWKTGNQLPQTAAPQEIMLLTHPYLKTKNCFIQSTSKHVVDYHQGLVKNNKMSVNDFHISSWYASAASPSSLIVSSWQHTSSSIPNSLNLQKQTWMHLLMIICFNSHTIITHRNEKQKINCLKGRILKKICFSLIHLSNYFSIVTILLS